MIKNSQEIIKEIDLILEKTDLQCGEDGYYDPSQDSQLAQASSLLQSAIKRMSIINSSHQQNADTAVQQYQLSNSHTLKILRGILGAIKIEYQNNYLKTVEEIIHADLFADFLEMADHLLQENYKDAAAVIGGGVLEEHLRKLCQKNNIPIQLNGKNKKLDTMNSELKSAGSYDSLIQKSITAWADLRNNAAHGHYSTYDKNQVALMISGVRDFIVKFPA